MSLRLDQRRVQVAYYFVDGRGRLLCRDCTPEGLRHQMEFAGPTYTEDACDQCGRMIRDVTMETTANVLVEYVACKIF